MGEAAADVAVVVVPFPAQGHLNQLLHFCRLVSAWDVPVHFIGSATHNLQAKSRLHGWDVKSFPNIQFHDFPLPPIATPPPNPHSAVKFPAHLQPLFDASLLHLRPHVARLLRSLSSSSRRVVVVHDSLMSFAAHESASLPNAETYAFHSVSAFANLFFQWEARGKLEEYSKSMFPEIPALTIDGCFTDEFVNFIRRQHKLTSADNGRLINTCRPIEAMFIDLFAKEPLLQNKKLFAIGPLNPVEVPLRRPRQGRHECLEWLDKQPPSSVVYVSFGTTSSMCCQQINELGDGLGRSQQRFVWVLRDADRGDIFTGGNDSIAKNCREMKENLVTGAAEKGRGFVVRGWAPQLEILGHPSTGAFMSHCGWNSCIESLSMGVPIVAWPMHSDQPRNALMVTDVLQVGVTMREWSRREEVVKAEKVEAAIRRLMVSGEGKEISKRARNLGAAVRKSVSQRGSSMAELDSFISHITRPC